MERSEIKTDLEVQEGRMFIDQEKAGWRELRFLFAVLANGQVLPVRNMEEFDSSSFEVRAEIDVAVVLGRIL